MSGQFANCPDIVHSSATDHSVFLNTSNVPNFSLLILLSFSLSDSSAYACGRQRALESASEHSADAEPWPAEVLSLGSSRALAGGCWFLVLVLVADALSFSHRSSPSSPYPYSPSPGDNQCLAHSISK